MIKKRCLHVALMLVLLILLPGCRMPNHFTVGCNVAELIEAINAANAGVNDSTIQLAAGCTYTLTAADNMIGFGYLSPGESQSNGLPAIDTPVYILGDAQDPPIIERSTAAGTPDFRFFFVSYHGSLSLEDLILQNGVNAWAGGAIGVDQGTLVMDSVQLLDNSSPGGAPYANTVGGGAGGALANWEGRVVISGSILSRNSAEAGGAIDNRGELIINSSILTDNTAELTGGAVVNMSTLQMDEVWFIANTAGTQSCGGLFNRGTASLNQVLFQYNEVTNGTGGAIANLGQDWPGELIISDSIFDGNQALQGGMLDTRGGTVTITTSTLRYNVATEIGGAIYNEHAAGVTGLVTISGTTLDGNEAGAGGGAFNGGQMIIQECTLIGNTAVDTGGGIDNAVTINGNIGDLSVVGSTFVGNSAGQGGALANAGDLVMVNSTVSGNQADYAAGILNDSAALIVASTVAYNSGFHGGGIDANNGVLTVSNSIVALNGQANCVLNVGTIQAVGENISSDSSCAGFQVFATPGLAPLGNNGGLTLTHALLPGSPAINVVSNCVDAAGSPLFVDQRGVGRPVGVQCDIGAYEYDPQMPPTVVAPLELPTARLEMNVHCRTGSSASFPSLTTLAQGQDIPVVGVNPSGTWYQVRPPDLAVACWVWGEAVAPLDDPDAIPIVADPVTPTIVISIDVTEEPVGPVLGCWVSHPEVGPNMRCIYPCPSGAWPGGACTP
jgi:hypothetical protein